MAQPVAHVGIVAKSRLKEATPHLAAIEAWLQQRGIEPVFEAETAALLPAAAGRRTADKDDLVRQVDILVILGGDGTLLSMADRIAAAGASTPILGVNFGSLGFLTEVTLPELYPALETAVTSSAAIEQRLMLRSTTLRSGRHYADNIALNDVVVTKAARARMIELVVSVGEEFVTRVKADGLIVASPTGSTAYNLAAGGPILQPTVDALVLTPIAPHTLTNRPIVIPSASTVRIQPQMDERDELYASFDGQAGFRLEAGDELRIGRAPERLHLIKPTTRSYFEVLRAKLKWGER